mgnify:CR=1 FL=1
MGSIRRTVFLLNRLLRDNVAAVSNRVYPDGIRVDSQLPRIVIKAITPNQQFAALGSGVPNWKLVNFKVEIYGRNPQDCDRVAEQVEDAVANNPNYRQTNTLIQDYLGTNQTVASNGYFILLKLNGGSETALIPAYNMYKRDMLVGGKWLQTATG